jgi:SAM-dependent methyltransferase
MDDHLKRSLMKTALFFDHRKVGDVGALGFRRSSDLLILVNCLERLIGERILLPGKTRFLDLGCADGRVNILLSYFSKLSVGIELDEWTVEECAPLRSKLEEALKEEDLLLPPRNIFLFQGDSTDEKVHREIERVTGVAFEEFDLFYTYLVMHEEFAALIRDRAKKGAYFMVYGLDKILPRYEGLRLIHPLSPLEGILAVYEKS